MKRTIKYILLAFLLFAGCRDPADIETEVPGDTTQVEDTTSPPVQSGVPSTEEMKIGRLSFGLTYDEVKEQYTDVSPLQSDVASQGEAFLSRQAFDRPAEVELNFSDNRLISYYYRLDSLACDSAEVFYERVQNLYSDNYGELREEMQQQGAYTARTSFWRADSIGVVATLGQQDSQCRLSWGYQEQMP